jgi:HPt (histidine-containing phosphotransfer) domain-containing protein
MDVKVYNFINLDYLDMMSDGDLEMKKVMLDMLFEELPQEISKMRQLTDASDWSELKSVSHKMKSTLSFVGCDAMTSSNSEIELICKDGGDTSKVISLMEVIEGHLDKVMTELKSEYAKL